MVLIISLQKRTNVALEIMGIDFGMDTRVCASCMLEISWLNFAAPWGRVDINALTIEPRENGWLSMANIVR